MHTQQKGNKSNNSTALDLYCITKQSFIVGLKGYTNITVFFDFVSFLSSLPPPLSSYYYALVEDPRGELVEAAIHLLIILFDCTPPLPRQQAPPTSRPPPPPVSSQQQRGGAIQTPILNEPGMANLFCGFLSRLHQNDVRTMPVVDFGADIKFVNPYKINSAAIYNFLQTS